MTSYFPIQPEEENIEKKKIWCDNCLEEDCKKVKAIVYCHDCEKNLCKNCDTIHQFSGYKNHIRDLQQSDLNFTENCPIHQKSKLYRYSQEKPNSEFPRLCNEHKNKPYQYFCLDHQHLLCVDCVILNHRRCNQIVNFKVGYEKIQNQLKELINEINSIKDKKLEFVEKIQNEKFNSIKEKQINLKLIKKKYQKLNEITQYQFRKMNEEISIHQNEKFIQLSHQLNKIQKEIEIFEKSEMIIKEIEICKKYNDYQQIL
ncbi:e3 ubiquitin-protein ligase trim [Anaeramoeba flamelloides]|uniref:E3 ubiquitin-protein ligase trim n=1 Tax=Anaeramoeba flamelloides TaxID=1746091 RepID=A0AAV7Y856_9EUKA|nr:e3 ubiquitin-protein ligase trim [Anaeramoeba flamelloides]